MANDPKVETRDHLATKVLFFSFFTIIVLTGVALIFNKGKSLEILNMILPVVATCVGTVIAFYFGKENFKQATELTIQQLSQKERETTTVASIMRPLDLMAKLTFTDGTTLETIREKLQGTISRLPLLNPGDSVRYMIHESSIDKYLVEKGSDNASLQGFFDYYKSKGLAFTVDQAFIVVAKNATLKAAKEKMQSIKTCQDIFVTETGDPKEPVLGWVSNIRLAKYLNT